MNIQEDHVSFEVAKLLKEKGFDWPCLAHWYIGTEAHEKFADYPFNWNEVKSDLDWLSRPTLQMALKWLREEHKLHIGVDVEPIYGKVKDEKGRNTCGLLYWYYMACGEWMNDKYNATKRAFVASGKSQEEAVEAALKYSLKNLI